MNVLVAIADDCCSKHILDFLARQKWQKETHFRLLTVKDGNKPKPHKRAGKNGNAPTPAKFQMNFAQELSGRLPGVHIERIALDGGAPSEIITQAENWPADLIVIGAHGRKGIDRILLGSVSSVVLDQAPCTVAIVKLPPLPALDITLSENDLPQQISSFELCETGQAS
ncbi:MAG TPA: universal stress protein [Oculatellaceae cyanobacterium]